MSSTEWSFILIYKYPSDFFLIHHNPDPVSYTHLSSRNWLRIPDYHRMDLAYTFGHGYKKRKKLKTSWTVSIYNLYARKNAFSVYFTQTPFTGAQANKLAVLGTVFPSITLNLENR